MGQISHGFVSRGLERDVATEVHLCPVQDKSDQSMCTEPEAARDMS